MQRPISLQELMAPVPGAQMLGNPQTEITGLCYDSRQVGPGDAFVCIPGLKADGHAYALEAVARGARALVVERDLPGLGAPQVKVSDSRLALAQMALRFYENPAAKLNLVGVTGTNGKTTVTYLIEAIFAEAGQTTGLIGTIAVKLAGETIPSRATTPESLDLQRLLRQMVDRGVKSVAMEVSSHALALDRVAGIEYDQAVFTNITRDHFDFHGTFDQYLAAKARLFSELGGLHAKPGPKYAVLNADDPQWPAMAEQTHAQVVTFGICHDATVRAEEIVLANLGSRFRLRWPGGGFPVQLHLPGRFNVANALAAAAVGLNAGIDPAVIARALGRMHAIPGRYEVIDEGQDFGVIVDFAHNPDALANILSVPTPAPRGRRIIVFGAEGGKDRGKRPLMGRTVIERADYAIITSDNLYDEDAATIAAEVEAGLPFGLERGTYEVILERREAIKRAFEVASPGDLVVIAGKGHETMQVVGKEKRPFDDRTVARELLAGLLANHRP